MKYRVTTHNTSAIAKQESSIAKHESADCVVRAIASATGVPYDEAHAYCKNHFGRKKGQGVYTHKEFDKIMANGGKLLGKKLEKLYDVRVSRGAYKKHCPTAPCLKRENMKKELTDRMVKFNDMAYKLHTAITMKVAKAFRYCRKGTYIIAVKAHVFAMIDGEVYGNYDDGRRVSKKVDFIWKIG